MKKDNLKNEQQCAIHDVKHSFKSIRWMFQYVRADGEEIDLVHLTRKQAERGRISMKQMGALVTPVSKVSSDYVPYKG